jgi:uncharacterized RDD family membrane protein YckC
LKLPDKAGSDDKNAIRYAGFWVRLLGFIIDGILLCVLALIIFSIIITSKYDISYLNDMNATMRATGKIDSEAWSVVGIFFLILSVLAILYSTISIGAWGRTIGKAALKLKVVKPDVARVGYWRALGRSLAYILNWFTLGISFLVIAFTPKKRGLHDYISDTIVIKTN